MLMTKILITEYRGGNAASLQTFLIISTCFLYLVAAGLLSKSVWLFEANHVGFCTFGRDNELTL